MRWSSGPASLLAAAGLQEPGSTQPAPLRRLWVGSHDAIQGPGHVFPDIARMAHPHELPIPCDRESLGHGCTDRHEARRPFQLFEVGAQDDLEIDLRPSRLAWGYRDQSRVDDDARRRGECMRRTFSGAAIALPVDCVVPAPPTHEQEQRLAVFLSCDADVILPPLAEPGKEEEDIAGFG